MGGGTGTGAAPVIARIAKAKGYLTVAVVTKPFEFEGKRRLQNAMKGIANLRKYVDTMVIIPNDKLLSSLSQDVSMLDALKFADDTLRQGICGISDLIATPALINLDFADVRTIIKGQGLAHMGIGRAKGENRILEAVRQAVSSPMLETTIEGARGIIMNITGDQTLSIGEVNEAANLINGVVDYSANFIFGANVDPNLKDQVVITIIATGFAENPQRLFNGNGQSQPTQSFATLVNPVQQEVPQATTTEKEVEQPVEQEVVEEVQEPVVQEKPVEKKREIPPFVKKLFGKK
jgi:cell division protein FtsZ